MLTTTADITSEITNQNANTLGAKAMHHQSVKCSTMTGIILGTKLNDDLLELTYTKGIPCTNCSELGSYCKNYIIQSPQKLSFPKYWELIFFLTSVSLCMKIKTPHSNIQYRLLLLFKWGLTNMIWPPYMHH